MSPSAGCRTPGAGSSQRGPPSGPSRAEPASGPALPGGAEPPLEAAGGEGRERGKESRECPAARGSAPLPHFPPGAGADGPRPAQGTAAGAAEGRRQRPLRRLRGGRWGLRARHGGSARLGTARGHRARRRGAGSRLRHPGGLWKRGPGAARPQPPEPGGSHPAVSPPESGARGGRGGAGQLLLLAAIREKRGERRGKEMIARDGALRAPRGCSRPCEGGESGSRAGGGRGAASSAPAGPLPG